MEPDHRPPARQDTQPHIKGEGARPGTRGDGPAVLQRKKNRTLPCQGSNAADLVAPTGRRLVWRPPKKGGAEKLSRAPLANLGAGTCNVQSYRPTHQPNHPTLRAFTRRAPRFWAPPMASELRNQMPRAPATLHEGNVDGESCCSRPYGEWYCWQRKKRGALSRGPVGGGLV